MKANIRFTGNFWDYFFKSLGLGILTVITFGLLLPYAVYWSVEYFVKNLEIEIPEEIVHIIRKNQ